MQHQGDDIALSRGLDLKGTDPGKGDHDGQHQQDSKDLSFHEYRMPGIYSGVKEIGLHRGSDPGLLVISQVFWLNYGAQGLRLPEVTDDLFDSCN